MPPEIHFLRPYWLLALLPLSALLLLLWRQGAADSAWRRVVDPHLLPYLLDGEQGRVRRLPLVLLALGWLLATLALAGPVWERLAQPVFGSDAKRVILLDLSPSMNAADLRPSRLARARFEILDLLHASREGQVALVAFGPEPFVVSPLTGDAETIAAQVPRLSTDLLPVPGERSTALALDLAGELIAQGGGRGGDVVLVTDGLGDGAGGSAIAAARRLAESGDRVSVLGMGTLQGAPEPGPTGTFSADSKGTLRIARLDRAGLEALAKAGGGIYLEPVPGDRDTRALLALSSGTGETVAQPGLTADQWREEGPWLLLLLLPLAALAFRRGWLIPVFALALVLPPTPSSATGWDDLWHTPDQQAARSLAAGDAGAAAARFEDPAWRAAARYRAGDYAGALSGLAGRTGAEADYNRGNALARLGRLDQAIASYERALGQDPTLDDARENLALVRKLKERAEHPKDGESRAEDGATSGTSGESKDGGQGSGSQPEKDGGSQQGQAAGESGQGKAGTGKGGEDRGAGEGKGGEQGGQGASAASSDRGAGSAGADGQAETQAQGQDSAAASAADRTGAPSAGRTGASPAPSAGDFGEGAKAGEPAAALADGDGESGKDASAARAGVSGGAPGAADGGAESRRGGIAPMGTPEATPEERERLQSMEAQLRRVPDDPSGLLRQRFLLQHLRREGRLP